MSIVLTGLVGLVFLAVVVAGLWSAGHLFYKAAGAGYEDGVEKVVAGFSVTVGLAGACFVAYAFGYWILSLFK